jgi:hypothetical protein
VKTFQTVLALRSAYADGRGQADDVNYRLAALICIWSIDLGEQGPSQES